MQRVPYWLKLDIFVAVMLVLLFETVRLPSGLVRQLALVAVLVMTFGGMWLWVATNAATLEQEAEDEMGEAHAVSHKPRWRARTAKRQDALK